MIFFIYLGNSHDLKIISLIKRYRLDNMEMKVKTENKWSEETDAFDEFFCERSERMQIFKKEQKILNKFLNFYKKI